LGTHPSAQLWGGLSERLRPTTAAAGPARDSAVVAALFFNELSADAHVRGCFEATNAMYPLPSQYRGYPAWASGSLLVLIDSLQPVLFWSAPGRRRLGAAVLRKPAGALPTLGWPVYHTDGRGQSTVHSISADGRWAVGDGCAWDLAPCLESLSAGIPLEEPSPILLPGEEREIWYPAALAGEHLLRVRGGVGEVWALASQSLVGRVAVGVSLPWVALLAAGRAYTSPKDRTLTVTDIATGHRLATLEHTQKVRAVCLSPDGRLRRGQGFH
jgi:hypothetical protein